MESVNNARNRKQGLCGSVRIRKSQQIKILVPKKWNAWKSRWCLVRNSIQFENSRQKSLQFWSSMLFSKVNLFDHQQTISFLRKLKYSEFPLLDDFHLFHSKVAILFFFQKIRNVLKRMQKQFSDCLLI